MDKHSLFTLFCNLIHIIQTNIKTKPNLQKPALKYLTYTGIDLRRAVSYTNHLTTKPPT